MRMRLPAHRPHCELGGLAVWHRLASLRVGACTNRQRSDSPAVPSFFLFSQWRRRRRRRRGRDRRSRSQRRAAPLPSTAHGLTTFCSVLAALFQATPPLTDPSHFPFVFPQTVVYVGNVPAAATEEDLTQFFEVRAR